MRLLHTIVIGLVALTATTYGAHHNYLQKVSLSTIPQGWSLHSAAPADMHITYRIAVKQNTEGVRALERYLLDHSSNPASDAFGAHLTKEEVIQMTKPHEHSVKNVVDWLQGHGITDLTHTPGSGFIKFRAPVSVGNKLLNTEYKVYQHSNGRKAVRTEAYSLPAHLHDHIDFVSPATRFPSHKQQHMKNHIQSVDSKGKYHPLRSLKAAEPMAGSGKYGVNPFVKEAPTGITLPANTLAGPPGLPPLPAGPITGIECNQFVTPECFRQLYETASYEPTATDKNSLAVTGFIGQYYNIENLDFALATFTAPYQGLSALTYPPPPSVGSGGDPQGENNAGDEADLDVQATVQGAFPTPVTFFSTAYDPTYTGLGGEPGNFPDEAGDDIYPLFLETVIGAADVPPVISTSYGENESGVDPEYAQRVCDEFMQLTSQGVSVLFSSGDGGVAGGQTGACDGPDANLFVPTFPAGCPYITAVGATSLNADGSESAAVDPTIPTFGGSGGFSNYFPRPSFQDTVVPEYITALNGEYDGLYNKSGRGFPDISAIGVNYALYLSSTALTGIPLPNGTDIVPIVFRIDGTSVASPVFASVVALVNDYRITNGKPALGYLNPAIYAQPTAGWYDVTTGSNGCGGQCGCGTDGFPAIAGWDAATGLGTPRFTALVNYLGGVGQGSTAAGAAKSNLVSGLTSVIGV